MKGRKAAGWESWTQLIGERLDELVTLESLPAGLAPCCRCPASVSALFAGATIE